MEIASVETRHCDAGWRSYHFVKVTTADGVVGWSEYDEGFGSPGVTTVIEALAPRVVGTRVHDHERTFALLASATRPAYGSVVGQGIGAIENAILDAKARTLGVPCVDLLGGRVRDRIPVYWSHCGTWRIGFGHIYGATITDLDGVRALGREVVERGFRALKTNIFVERDGRLRSWAPGFGLPFAPDRNVTRDVLAGLRDVLAAFRDGTGPDVDILLDLNFNATAEGYRRIVRELADHDLFWVEIDTHEPGALADVRAVSPHPVASCETLIGLAAFLPYLRLRAMDVAIVDAVWNGVWQSLKIAAAADAHEINVAPHNFYGHLATMMNAHFAAAVPNLRIMETDVDRLPWDAEVFSHEPEIVDGHLVLPDRPGWGTEPVEEALAAHPSPEGPGFLVGRRR